MFKIEVPSLPRGIFYRLPHARGVFRMNPLECEFHGRFRRRVAVENLKRFLRPNEFAGRNPPAKTPGVTEPLRFCEVRFSAAQFLIEDFLLGNVERGADKPREDPALEDGIADAAYESNTPLRVDGPILFIAAHTLRSHFAELHLNEAHVIRVHDAETLLDRRRALCGIEPNDVVKFLGPVFADSRGRK